MSITEVRNQGYEDNTDAAAWAINPPAAGFAAGNLLVALLFHEDTATAATITDTDGNTWTRVTTQQMPGGEQIYLSPYWCIPAGSLPSSDTITLTWGVNVRPKILLIREYNSSTGWPASPQDVFTSASGTGTSLSAGTTSATAQAEEVVVVGYGVDGNATTFTGDAGYSGGVTFGGSFSGSQGDEKGYSQYKVLSSAGTQTNTVTRSAGTVWWAGAIVAFKNNSGGTGATVTAVPASSTGSAPAAVVSAGGTNATVTAVPALSAGSAPVAAVQAGGTVTAVPALSAGSAPPANQIVSVVVNAPAVISLGSAPVPVVSAGGTGATVTAVPAASAGSAPIASLSAGVSVTAVPSASAGTAPVAALTIGVTVTAAPAISIGQAPRPTVSPSPAGGNPSISLTTTFAEDAA